MNLKEWFSTLPSVRKSIESADKASWEIARWIDRHVVPDDVYPSQRPPELEKSLKVLGDALRSCEACVSEVDEGLTRILLRCLHGQHLTRGELYLIMALDPVIVKVTNKSTGMSDFDDYEVFEHFCYEDGDEFGYITPSLGPPRPPVTEGDTTTSFAHSPWGRQLAPEEIFWDRLRPEQRRFFERHLPEVATRFKRDGG